MKKILKLIAVLFGAVLFTVAVMAITNICPPEGPWPMPPWCPGTEISVPFIDPPDQSSSQPIEGSSEGAPEIPPEMPENERLARMAVGLMADLAKVNTYFNEASSSLGEVRAFHGFSSPAKCAVLIPQDQRRIPPGFLGPLPSSGYIPAPSGGCGAGAIPSASFKTAAGDPITPELLEEKEIEVIDFEELTGGEIEGQELESTLNSLITPGDMSLATDEGWNEEVWTEVEDLQTPAESLMDYYLWTVAEDIEETIVDSMASRMETLGLPPQVVTAFLDSDISGWYASPESQETDRIASMEIEAVFVGRTEGTIHERRDFSIPELGEMPVFGPLTGEGSVVYHDPDLGDYPFDLELEWTAWDELGRVTAGEILFTDEAGGVVIEMSIFEDDSREAVVYQDGDQVGVVTVSPEGEIIYQDMTQ